MLSFNAWGRVVVALRDPTGGAPIVQERVTGVIGRKVEARTDTAGHPPSDREDEGGLAAKGGAIERRRSAPQGAGLVSAPFRRGRARRAHETTCPLETLTSRKAWGP